MPTALSVPIGNSFWWPCFLFFGPLSTCLSPTRRQESVFPTVNIHPVDFPQSAAGPPLQTEPLKQMQVFPVGGWEASAGSHLIRYVPVRWSHKHRNCSWLPLARQHRQGIIWSTSWYHGLLTLLVSLSVGDPQIGTWIENGNANLRLSFWDTSSRSAFVHLLLLKGVSTAPHR